MPQIKIIRTETQVEDEIIDTLYGDPVPLDGALTYSAQCVLDVDTPSTKTFDSGAANVSDAATVADLGVKEVSDITVVEELGAKEVSQAITVADVAGSLNSTFFLFSAMDTGGATETDYYVWLSNGTGVDPAVPGATAIPVVYTDDDTASTLGGLIRSAITSVAGAKVVVSGATDTVIITDRFMGNATNAADGSAATGFTISTTTAGVASNLNSKYFNYETKNLGGATVNLRYGWYNVNGEGVDPAPASRTGISIPITLGATADTDVAAATRTALAADTLVAITGGTNHCIITNDYMGNVTNTANGAASPAFSYVITPGVASNLNNTYYTFSSTLNAVNYAAWFNINSEGTAPVLAGRTMIEVAGAASITANDLATAGRDAIDLAIGATIVISGATNHIILTNSTRGTCTAAANGAVSPGFTITNSPAGANTEVDTATDSVTIPTHGLTTGLKGQLTTTGTLPAGLNLATDYFIIVVDANTVQFASSLANALAGTEIDITDTGADASVNTFTSTSIAGATVKLQKSNDDLNSSPTNWSDEGSATNITADANLWLEKINPTGNWMRLAFTITAGRISTSNTIVVKGPN